ncbi:UDP-N-acetylmuramoyl-tripeptide--D-alanyl-D-alanine ligase [Aeromicrobium sp. CTD01-1L150]|uniref:UDP-N-acetylmuramoyl-tripeptide--D-alanyl-D- alanine ligase n=1 Tax=Aeromicrobium sp. CTD01-1L150 TaxID=3341830 RepID=UPI0035C0BE53
MIPMTTAEIAEVVGGQVHGDPAALVSAPSAVDSRVVEDGGLFVAIAGERVDGHDFVATAREQGAAAVLGSRVVDAPCVVVDDATHALGLLARHVLEQVRPTVVAITGSQGKTSVKDLVAHLLGEEVVATRGNNNNELGVPLTVLRTHGSTRHVVVEMGARGIGHIARLCRVAPPDVAVVLNVGSAHVGEFGSVDNIAVAKGELVQALRPGGRAVLNIGDPRVAAMARFLPDGTAALVSFGRADDGGSADVAIRAVRPDGDGEPDVTLAWGGHEVTVHVPLVGEHHAENLAAAVAAVVAACGDDADALDDLGERLEQFRSPSPMRMERHRRADGVTVVDDSYNANPESMAAALRAVRDMGAGRRVAVLGEMLELGADAHEQHVRTGRLAADLGYERVLAVGEPARGIAEGAGAAGQVVTDVSEAVSRLRAWLTGGDVVLVKASRGARLERVTAGLLAD